MKKVFTLILTVLYLATTSGATIHLHYCMGKLIEKDLWKAEKKACSKCGMEKSSRSGNDCCKDTQQQVKIEKEHQKAETVFQPLQLVSTATSYSEVTVVSFSSITEENPSSNAPPRSSGPALFKRNCVFRI